MAEAWAIARRGAKAEERERLIRAVRNEPVQVTVAGPGAKIYA